MTVTNYGVAEIAKLIIGTGTAIANVSIGTGTTAIAATYTTLNNEYKRATATTSTVTTDVTGDSAQFVALFNFTESKAITEAGLHQTATGNTLCAGQTFAAINVVDTDSILITYKLDLD